MKLILLSDNNYKELFNCKNEILQMASLHVDIQRENINVDKSMFTKCGTVSPDRFVEIVAENVFNSFGFFKSDHFQTYKEIMSDIAKYWEVSPFPLTVPDNFVGYEDPELSTSYSDNKIWVIAYDTGFKNIEIVENGVYTTKAYAEKAARQLSETELFIGTELTVIGIPIKDIDYGDTFFVPGEEDALEDGLVEISEDLFVKLAKQAHQEDLTVNELANALLREHIDSKENGNAPYSDEELPF